MKIVFVNRYFYPDNSATSQILTDLSFHLAKLGHDIHIVSSRCNYTNHKISYEKNELIEGLHVHRIFTTRFGRGNLVGRVFDYLSFYCFAFFKLLVLVSKDDVVVVKTDPPMISVVVYGVCFVKRAKFINWLQDLFPEVGARLGIRVLSGRFGDFVKSVRNCSLKAAVCNVVIGDKMKDLVHAEGMSLDKIATIHNWSDVYKPADVTADVTVLKKKWGLGDKFIVGYSGNFGLAHDYQTILNLICQLQTNADIVFLFIGGGAYYKRLQSYVEFNNLKNVIFKPYQPREGLTVSLSVPNIHLVTLIPRLEGLIVPSKYYGVAAVAKPAIFIGDSNGEVANIIKKNNCGLVFESGEFSKVADAIAELNSKPEILLEYGSNAFAAYESKYSKHISLQRWQKLIDSTLVR